VIVKRDITPKLDYLLAIRNMDWDAKGAVSELVDNSLGEARGDASYVLIQWDSKTREVTVLDDGRGMDDVADLFQLGKTRGMSPRDIGKYGSGGTMACLWLGSEVSVWTLRDGQVASAQVAWSKLRNWEDLSTEVWARASASNTPVALLSRGHGTLIRLKVPKAKRIVSDAIQKELAKRYAPGLRHGKLLRWETLGKKSGEVRLEAPQFLTDPIDIRLDVKVHGKARPLTAEGQVGVRVGLGPSESKIEVGFGHRVIKRTSDCYSSPDGQQSYGGVGVTGWVDLGEGWQDFLTTTKTDFHDAQAWDSLMEHLFFELEPLLKQVEDENERYQLAEIALNLELSLQGAFQVDATIAANANDPKYEWTKSDNDGEVPAIERKDDAETGVDGGEAALPKASGGSVRLEFKPQSDMAGCLCDPRITGKEIRVFIDKDDACVKEARERKNPIQSMLLSALFVPAVCTAVLELSAKEQREILRPKMAAKLAEMDGSDRFAFLHGHVMRAMHPNDSVPV
jgi:hypothetical protein